MDKFHYPFRLFDFSLDAHSGGSARKQGASVVAKEFSDVCELCIPRHREISR